MRFFDKKNEIDMIAFNEFYHTGVVVEIKRIPCKNFPKDLQDKVDVLSPKSFGEYILSL